MFLLLGTKTTLPFQSLVLVSDIPAGDGKMAKKCYSVAMFPIVRQTDKQTELEFLKSLWGLGTEEE
jgi:hypothetical protein